MMKSIIFSASIVLTAMSVAAQEIPATGDAYMAAQLATEDLNGTARYVAMGGAMDALGADLSTMGSNPAGIGLFRRSQAAVSFGFNSQEDGKSFADGTKTNASFDQAGFVFATRSGRHGFLNFGFNFHKSRNFDYVLSAVNRLSAVREDGTREYFGTQNSQSVFKDMNGVGEGSSMPYSQLDYLYYNNMSYTDGTFDEAGNFIGVEDVDYISDYGFDSYTFDRAHTGYIGEYDFNLSGNINNRVYLGLTVGLHSVHYKGFSEYYESLDADNPRPWYRDVLISDNHKITGYGYNIKAGIIFRPVEESPFRIGAAVHSPTFYKLTTDNYTTIGTDVDWSSASEDFRFNTPWRFNVSLGHTIGSTLALGAVYEYADYSTCDMRTIDGYSRDLYTDTEYENSSSDPAMKRQIEKSLKGVSTLKLGMEYKLDPTIAVRLGYNYVTTAYQESAVRDQTVSSPGVYYASTTDYTNWKDTHRFTCGMGFTFDQLRLDLAYQYQMRDGNFYPFMRHYSADYEVFDQQGQPTGQIETMTNDCQPVSVKDNRSQVVATLTYTF